MTRMVSVSFLLRCPVTIWEIELTFVQASGWCSAGWQSPLLSWPCRQRPRAGFLFPLSSWYWPHQGVKHQPSFTVQSGMCSWDRPFIKGQAWESLVVLESLNYRQEGNHPGGWLEGLGWDHRWDQMVETQPTSFQQEVGPRDTVLCTFLLLERQGHKALKSRSPFSF